MELPDKNAFYKDSVTSQIDQLPPVKTLKGIYRFGYSEDGLEQLVWCFSNNDKQSPTEFVVSPGSQRTMVTLKRYVEASTETDWAKLVISNQFFSK